LADLGRWSGWDRSGCKSAPSGCQCLRGRAWMSQARW
jgi:hypothetical protein